MTHFAKIESDIVTQIIVAEQENIDTIEGTWVETTFAGIGFTYDVAKNKFIKPQPYPSWSLDENDDWQPPLAYPDDGKHYDWNEEISSWEILND